MTSSFYLTAEAIQTTIDQYFAATRSSHRVDDMVACFAEDSVNYDPADGPALVGHDALRQYFTTIAQLFTTVGLTAEFTSINGNQAAVKWLGEGIGHNGQAVRFEGIDLFELNAAGKIQSLRAYWNPAALLTSLEGAG